MCINIVPFEELFEWQNKSSLKAGLGKQAGKYCFFICSDTVVKRFDEYLINKEALIFGTGGKASIHYCNQPFAYSTDCAVACKKNDNIILKYIYYYFRQKNLRILQDGFKGSGLQHISKSIIGKIAVPVPPLEEQRRIVAKIEELFSLLESGTESLQKAKGQLAAYRQAVLKEAFADIKETTVIKNISSLVTSGSRGWSKYYSDSGEIFVRIGNLTRTGIEINLDKPQYVSVPNNAEGSRSMLKTGDVLISITADLGSIGLVTEKIGKAYINQHIALVRFTNKKQSKFMAWYLRGQAGQKELLKNKRGAGKVGLGLDDIRQSKVPVVTDSEAELITVEIESRLSVCDNVEKTIETALEKSEALRQSILRQAFEGGL